MGSRGRWEERLALDGQQAGRGAGKRQAREGQAGDKTGGPWVRLDWKVTGGFTQGARECCTEMTCVTSKAGRRVRERRQHRPGAQFCLA